ncbi:MAG: NUDIX hydrolase [Candidatus Hydrogenedentes bacterium]|nr:NUDIX hydrolase [Candidatus Hydrogenedentota bacterium]
MEKWKESSLVYEGKIVSLRVGSVELEGNGTAYREVVEHPGGVCIVPLLENRVILVKQFRIAIGKYILEAPAGKIEKGDNPVERGKKELLEETGYEANSFEYLGSAYSSVGYCSEIIHFYLATDLKFKGAKPEVDEKIELIEMPLEEVKERLRQFGFEDSKTYIALQAMLYKLSEEKKD